MMWAAAIAAAVVTWSQGCLRKPPEVQVEPAPPVQWMPATKSGFVPPPPEDPPPATEPEPEPEPNPEPDPEPEPDPKR